VGDGPFQKKCLARIEEFRLRGKTIIYVSHDMNGVRNLCHRALLIENGVIAADGPPEEVIPLYQGTAQPAIPLHA